MNDTPLHSTLRQLRRLLASPRAWAAVLLAGIIVGAVGPFGTYADLDVPPRLAYWLTVVSITYWLGLAIASVIEALLPRRLPLVLRLVFAGALAGVPVALSVYAINGLALEPGPRSITLGALLVYCPLIAGAVTLATGLVAGPARPSEEPPSGPSGEQGAPPLLARLKPHQRGRLLALSVTDHYVEVRTSAGKGLLLMRLSDAMAETSGEEGLRIHRSHWVAHAAVKRLLRVEGRLTIELETGERLPVSRSYARDVRAAGFPD